MYKGEDEDIIVQESAMKCKNYLASWHLMAVLVNGSSLLLKLTCYQ